jgi:uncharacterized protein YbjT (DUF2867 family)
MMTRVLILGANGQLARNTAQVLLDDPAVTLTLYLRQTSRLKNPAPDRVKIIDGDVLDGAALRHAMKDQDNVYANLAGDMAAQARTIIDARRAAGLKRLIFISSMGIYGEVPGEKYRSVLDPYRGFRGPDRGLRSRLHDPAGRAGSHGNRKALTGSHRRASPFRVTILHSTAYPR